MLATDVSKADPFTDVAILKIWSESGLRHCYSGYLMWLNLMEFCRFYHISHLTCLWQLCLVMIVEVAAVDVV